MSESIQAEGCRDPLLVWKGHNIVLDGHTRRDLCIEHKKQVKVREVELPDEKAAVEYILQIQRQRRNLTREAMSYFRGREYNAVKQLRGGDRRGRRPKDQSDPLARQPQSARREVRRLGDDDQAGRRVRQGDRQDRGRIRRPRGQAATPGCGREADARPGPAVAQNAAEERKAAVEQLVELGEPPRAKKERRSAARQPKEVAQSIVARLKGKGEDHARAVLQQMARLLGREVSEKSSEK